MKDGRRLLIFTMNGDKYALELEQVAEIMEAPTLSPIPRAPLHFTGAMNFHGGIVPIVDLARFLDLGDTSHGGRVLVLDRGIGNLALLVERVEGIFPGDMVLEEHPPDMEMAAKILQLPDGEIRLLSPEKIVDRLEDGINAPA